MSSFIGIWHRVFRHSSESHPKVALVLSAGGARGYAHIGAIEELLRQGFEITSVAGTSMGALVGGLFAAGKLEELKEWFYTLDRKKIRSLIDISLGLDHVVEGDKIIKALETIVPDTPIERLPIPFTAVATDITKGQEAVFERGSLFRAIRSSISIPMFFKPMNVDGRTFVDGGLLNPLPLNRVHRQKGDILVAVNVSSHESFKITYPTNGKQADDEPSEMIDEKTTHKVATQLRHLLSKRPEWSENYYSMSMRVLQLMVQRNTFLSEKLTPPDIVVDIPMEEFGLFDFAHAKKISETGAEKMREAIECYRNKK
jgi:NTE family protein